MESFVIFTDGACSGNPGKGGWGVVILTPEGQVWELGGGAAETTNNRMELLATIEALRKVGDAPGEVHVHTDSTYVIRGITQWSWAWRRSWQAAEEKGIANVDLWKRLVELVAARPKNSLHWKYVRGHTGVPGNERVDEIAVAFTQGRHIDLYRGPITKYPVDDLLEIPEDTSLPPIRQQAEKKEAYSYVSVVNGAPARHKTWKECEARVKGRSGAKFKKTVSAENEAEILGEWGYNEEELKSEG